MFIFILLAGLTLVLVVAGAGCLSANVRTGKHDLYGVPSSIAAGVAVVLIFFTVFIWLVVYVDSYSEIGSMEAFYHDTLDAYEYTVEATGEIEIVGATAGLIDIAYQGQGNVTSERLRELRNKVSWYNRQYWFYQRYNDTFFGDPFLADLPDDLRPIHLGVER